MQNIMLDLETMGTNPDALILAIGAVEFDIEIGTSFYVKIDIESAVKCGGVIDASTVLWWMKQNDAARRYITSTSEDVNVLTALSMFTEWFNSVDGKYVWGNGSDFDNVILSSAYRNCKMEAPWKFYNNRCYRTLKNLYSNVMMPSVGTKHNAVDDAESQAMHAIAILKERNR